MRTIVSASILAVFGLGCSLSALASPLDSPLQGATPLQGASTFGGDSTAGQIDALNARIAVLEAQLKIAKLQASIKKAKDGGSTAGTAPGFQGVPSYPMPIGNVGQPGGSGGMPRVESISGAGSRLSATVSLPDGGRRIVVPGSRLPGGLVVRSVTANGVEVSGKSGEKWLSFTDSGQSGSLQGATPSQGVIPTSPPVFGPSTGTGSPFPVPGAAPSQDASPMPGGGMQGGE
jgi:type IV pilus biogenesis protein PilP